MPWELVAFKDLLLCLGDKARTSHELLVAQVGEPWRSRRDISIEAIMYSLETAFLGPRGHVALRIKLWSYFTSNPRETKLPS
jgi:hypothetical protein